MPLKMEECQMKKLIYFLLLLTLISFTACTRPPQNEEPLAPPAVSETEVTLYYANRAYVETGDENLEKLIPIKRTLRTENENLHMSILNELKKAPDNNDMVTELFPEITFTGVEIKNNVAHIDISSENLNGGSLQEFFLMSQIIYTFTELEGIDKVQFLVDGKIKESLMGHFPSDKPLGRNEM